MWNAYFINLFEWSECEYQGWKLPWLLSVLLKWQAVYDFGKNVIYNLFYVKYNLIYFQVLRKTD